MSFRIRLVVTCQVVQISLHIHNSNHLILPRSLSSRYSMHAYAQATAYTACASSDVAATACHVNFQQSLQTTAIPISRPPMPRQIRPMLKQEWKPRTLVTSLLAAWNLRARLLGRRACKRRIEALRRWWRQMVLWGQWASGTIIIRYLFLTVVCHGEPERWPDTQYDAR